MKFDSANYIKQSELLKILAHPVRLCIINGLLETGESNVSNMMNCLDTPQSTISQHLQKLKAAGIVEGRRSGLEIYYKICDNKTIEIINTLTRTYQNA